MPCVWDSTDDPCPPYEQLQRLGKDYVNKESHYYELVSNGGYVNTARWGMIQPVCSYHFYQSQRIIDGSLNKVIRQVRNKKTNNLEWQIVKRGLFENWCESGCSNLRPDEVEDFAKLAALMRDKLGFVRFAQNLDQKVQGEAEALSSVLERYEAMCWFPNTRAIPTGVLPAPDFNDLVKNCWVGMKDIGAGKQHGEWSHRLQWHVVMRAMTTDFTNANYTAVGFNYSPLYLYHKLGKSEARKHVGVLASNPGKCGVNAQSSSSLWGYLFDLGGTQGWYNAPDQVHSDLLAGTFGPTLKQIVTAKVEKRDQLQIDRAALNLMAQHPGKAVSLADLQKERSNRVAQDKLTAGGYHIYKQGSDWMVVVDNQRRELTKAQLDVLIQQSLGKTFNPTLPAAWAPKHPHDASYKTHLTNLKGKYGL